MNDTKKQGNLTELQCMTAFTELGYVVSIPFGEDSRYDFIADIDNKLYKIQCKTSSEILDGEEVTAIRFKTVRQSGSRASTYTRTKYQPEEIDYFATSYQGKCYLVPLIECSNEKTLRIRPPKNGQKIGVTFLKDCELSEVIKQL
jgi:hypothetical protein